MKHFILLVIIDNKNSITFKIHSFVWDYRD